MGKKKALTTDEIISRCEKVGLTYVSHYINEENGKRGTVVIAKCQCGEQIKITMKNLGPKAKQGKTCSCKRCGAKKVNVNTIEKAKQKFLQELNKNDHFLLSEYTTSNEKVLIDFKCGHEPHWMTPSCYMSGQRCPKCYRERQVEITRQRMDNMTEEEKEQWKQKIKNTFDNKTEEEKAIISKNISNGLANMEEEAKQDRLQKMSEKAKQQHSNMSEQEKEQWKQKLRQSSPHLSGEKHPMWRHDLTDEDRQCRTYKKGYSTWTSTVKQKANYTCDCCGYIGYEKDGFMVAHHLQDFHAHKELATDINNGVCLCEHCHKEFHSYMGGYHVQCTEQDYIDFKQMKQEQLNSENDTNSNVA